MYKRQPLVFGIVLLRFPAGLFVYWVSSNVISIFQNLLIYRNAPKPNAEKVEAEATDADSIEDGGYRAKEDAAPSSIESPDRDKKARTRKR